MELKEESNFDNDSMANLDFEQLLDENGEYIEKSPQKQEKMVKKTIVEKKYSTEKTRIYICDLT